MDIMYTTSNAIRACIGVTDKELSDAQLTDLNLGTQLSLDLDEVYPDHATAKTEGEAGGATALQLKTWNLIKMYSQYQGAAFMLPGLQNLIPQKLADAGFEMQRFTKDNLDKTKAEILGMRDKYRSAIAELLGETPYEAYSVLVRVTPTYNPVTSDGTT